MQDDRASTTAVWVAMGRALADGRRAMPGFSDPIALRLLADEHRRAVEGILRRARPRSLGEVRLRTIARFTEALMGPRTVEIDRGLSDMPPGFQLVILGAGLDARAYRLAGLRDSVVYEVDHPASQAFKRDRVVGLTPLARALRHVPVDFTRQDVATELAAAGHDTAIPTAWVFEGVISYLSPPEVDAAIASMASRSAPGSRLLATYNLPPGPLWNLTARFAARAGEPHRASFEPAAMHALLARHGAVVRSDRDGLQRLQNIGVAPTVLHRFTRFHHVVIADLGPVAVRSPGTVGQRP